MDNTTYEFFIRRAWKCDRFKKGADTDIWESLLYKKHFYEQSIGELTENKLKKEYDNKFAQIKDFINNAYNNLLYRATKGNNNKVLVDSLLDLKNQADASETPQELFDVLKSSFQILNDNNL